MRFSLSGNLLQPCGLIGSFAVGLLVCSSLQAAMVAHWNFEEGSGDTTRDQVNMRDDPIIDGTWVTDVPEGVAGSFSLEFNGSTSLVDTGYEGIGGNAPRTIAAWIKLAEITDTAAGQSIASYGGRAANGEKWHFRINPDGAPRVPGAVRTEAQGGNQTGDTNLADGNWHFVASVFPGGEGANNTDVIHYVNGELEGETGTTDEPINTVVGPDVPSVSIGARRQGGNSAPDGPLENFFNGWIHEVIFFDEALSQGAIQDLMRDVTPGDFNEDGVVNRVDFGILRDNLAGHLDGDVGFAEGDYNFDGKIDLNDFVEFKAAFPAVVAQATGIPEPSSLVICLFALGILPLLKWWNRGR